MIIYLDENIPAHLAKGFQLLQQPEGLRTGFQIELRHLNDDFERGTLDNIWLPRLGDINACLITHALSPRRQISALQFYQQFQIGVFFLKIPTKKEGLSTWTVVQALAKNWPDISRIAHEEERPFAYEFSWHRKMKELV